jgi:alpha-tubulin suppressor-like RCC1 family protein
MSGILQGLLASLVARAPEFYLYAWGYAAGTPLNTSSNTYTPTKVGTLNNWYDVDVGTGAGHSIKTDGTLWGWGSGHQGSLGDGTYDNKSSPVQIGALTNWYQASGGAFFTAAVKTDGTLWSWGRGVNGVLGTNSTAAAPSPVQIGSLTTWQYVSAIYGGCFGIKTDGTLWSWGKNDLGQLGIGDVNDRSSPVQVGALTNWARVAGGFNHIHAVKTDGTLWFWGSGGNGVSGLSTSSAARSSPTQVGSLTNWAKVSGNQSTCNAVKTDGTLWGWGLNSEYGQVGNNSLSNVNSPVQIGSLTNWADLATSPGNNQFIHAVKTDGTLWAWGRNIFGTLGDGSSTYRSSPVQIGSLTSWTKASVSIINGFGIAQE